MNPWDSFIQSVNKYGSVSAFDRVLACVSGGPDSVAMLHLLWRLKKTLRFELGVVYIDHGLRKESIKEEKFVSELSELLNLPYFTARIPVRKHSGAKKISIEAAARELRYGEFEKICRAHGYDKIATGHNANDNAETLIMWLLRGTGPDGLSGIPQRRGCGPKLEIIRPILALSRREIIAYLKSQKLKFVTDKSNFSMDYTRNKIRHNILPALEKINKKVVEHILNLTRMEAERNEFFNEFVRGAKERSVVVKSSRIELDLKRFIGYNKAVQSHIVKDFLPEKKSVSAVERVLNWAIFSPEKELGFSRSWRLRKAKNKIILERGK